MDGPVLRGGFARSYHLEDTDRYFSPKKHNLNDRPLLQPKPEDGYYATEAIAGHAIDWLVEHESNHRGQPFFLYIAFTSPHFPIQALPEDIAHYRDRYKEGWDRIRQSRWERQKTLGIITGSLSVPRPQDDPPVEFAGIAAQAADRGGRGGLRGRLGRTH